jgi:D-isomer specific 2-hydroxyacid dehydrogenase, NAD binding domain
LALSELSSSILTKPLQPGCESLPLLDELSFTLGDVMDRRVLKDTVVVYIHHALQTSLNVMDCIIRAGILPQNVFVLGKSYSNCPSVVEAFESLGVHYIHNVPQKKVGAYEQYFLKDVRVLWSHVLKEIGDSIKNIIVLDHGGHGVRAMPSHLIERYQVIAIEKTTAGVMGYSGTVSPKLPIINLAGSAIKRKIESPMIAKAVVAKMADTILQIPSDKICGVIGMGAIGEALSAHLLMLGKRVMVYDSSSSLSDKNIPSFGSLKDAILQSDYIFGCTGQDITEGLVDEILCTESPKVFLSCSSEDKEFLSLLTREPGSSQSVFDDIQIATHRGGVVTIKKGGFPVNFDHSGESVPANKIQLTRALVYSAFIQSVLYLQKPNLIPKRLLQLELDIQSQILALWQKHSDFSKGLGGNAIEWLRRHSFGESIR